VAGNVLRAVSALLSDRKYFVQDGYARSSEYPIAAGTPQGCVLSPTLFLVYINSALFLAGSYDVIVLAYADDIALMPSSAILDRRGDKEIKALQQSLNRLSLWSWNWCVKFSPEKSQVVIFTKRKLNISITLPQLVLTGFKLVIVDQYTYLGYPLNSQLSWKKLRDEIISGINSRNYLISKIIFSGVLKFPSIRLLSLNFSRSAATYFLPLARFSDRDYEVFDSKLLRPLRAALHVPRYTPTHLLQAEFGINPMIIQAKISLLSYFESVMELPADYLQSIRAEKDWYRPFYVPMEDNYCHLNSNSHYARACLSDLPITLSLSDFRNPNRIRYDPIKSSVSHQVILNYACRLTNQEIGITKRKYPLYLKYDRLDIASMRCRLRLKVSRLNADLEHYKLSVTRSCPHCTVRVQDAEHMIMNCPALKRLRDDSFLQLANIGISASTEIFLGHVVNIPQEKQLDALRITGRFLSAARHTYEF
jgi:hypothetical protein